MMTLSRSGATGLNAAVQSNIVTLSWRYIPTVLASSLIMLAWALIINNLGRRRYPIYWWAAGKTFVSATPAADEKERRSELREVEAGLRSTEGHLFRPSNGEDGSDDKKGSGHGDRAGNTSTNSANSV
jgi:CBS-domain-containing membrane protein